jgi:hypothetical protein
MFLIDFYNNYEGVKIRDYVFYYPDRRFAKEMAAYMYNGYILFTATIGDQAQDDIFAIMMIFGFANGTDFTTDISPYLMDTGYYDESNNLYDFLMTKMTIDNNIFAYEKIEKIRLVKICDELLLYRGKLNANKEESTLPLEELFDANHTLLQNRAIKKVENKLYTLEYRFLVKEPIYETLYKMPDKIQKKWNLINFATNIFAVNKNKLNFKKIFINKFKVSKKNIKDCKKYNYL